MCLHTIFADYIYVVEKWHGNWFCGGRSEAPCWGCAVQLWQLSAAARPWPSHPHILFVWLRLRSGWRRPAEGQNNPTQWEGKTLSIFPGSACWCLKTHESRLTFWASTSAAFLLLLTFSVCSPIFAIRASMFCFFKVSWASCDANLALRSSTWIGGKKEITQIIPSLCVCMCVAFNGGEKWQHWSLIFLHWPCG